MTDKLWDGHDLSEYDPRLKPHLVVVTLLVVLEHGHAEPGREAQEEAFSCISYGSPRGRGRRRTGWSGGTHPTRRSWCHPRTLTTMLILRLSILLTPGPHSDSDRFCQYFVILHQKGVKISRTLSKPFIKIYSSARPPLTIQTEPLLFLLIW